jgi:hypothetical protein
MGDRGLVFLDSIAPADRDALYFLGERKPFFHYRENVLVKL